MRKHQFCAIFNTMEQDSKTEDAGYSSEDRELARKLMDAWTKPALNENVSREREVDYGRSVLGMGAMQGSGFAFPGLSSRSVPRPQTGEEHQGDDREASFNKASEAEGT